MLQSTGAVVMEAEGDSWVCRQAKRRCAGNEPSLLLLADLLPFCSNAQDPDWSPHAPLLPSPQRSSAWSATTCCKASGATFAALVWMSRCWRMRMTTGKLLRLVSHVCVCSFHLRSLEKLCCSLCHCTGQSLTAKRQQPGRSCHRALPPVPLLRDRPLGQSGELGLVAARTGWSLQCVWAWLSISRREEVSRVPWSCLCHW